MREAGDVLRRMAEIDPSDLKVRSKLADLYTREGNPEKAVDEHVAIAEELDKKGHLAEALQLLEKALRSGPASPRLLATAGPRSTSSRRTTRGRSSTSRRRGAAAPADREVSLRLAEAYLGAKRPDDAAARPRGPARAGPAGPGGPRSSSGRCTWPRAASTRPSTSSARGRQARRAPAGRPRGRPPPADRPAQPARTSGAWPSSSSSTGSPGTTCWWPRPTRRWSRPTSPRAGSTRPRPSSRCWFSSSRTTSSTARSCAGSASSRAALPPASTSISSGRPRRCRSSAAPPARPAGLELSGPLSADDQEFVGEHLAEGRVFRKYGLGDKARDQFEAILGRFPDNLEALQELADLHREKGESEAAAQRLRVMAEVHRLKGDAALAARLDADAAALAPAPPAVVAAPAPARRGIRSARAPRARRGGGRGRDHRRRAGPRGGNPRGGGPPRGARRARARSRGARVARPARRERLRPRGGGEIGGHFIDEEEAPAADFDLEEAGPDLAPPPVVTTGLVAQAASAGAVAGDIPPDLRRALDEVESYVSMGFVEDAKGVLGEVRSRFASHPALVQRLAELGLGVEPAPPMSAEDLLLAEDAPAPPPAEEPLKFGADFLEFTPTTASPAPPVEVPEPPAGRGGGFDLDSELGDLFGAQEAVAAEAPAAAGSGTDLGDASLSDIFREFQKGVDKQLGKEDYETRYNLGIAYKEMGLVDEAIAEFQLAAKDEGRLLECASMLGICFIEKGMPKLAVKWFEKGLSAPGRTEEEYQGLRYDLASALEQSGEPDARARPLHRALRAGHHLPRRRGEGAPARRRTLSGARARSRPSLDRPPLHPELAPGGRRARPGPVDRPVGLELAAPAVARPPRRRAERIHPRGGHRARARQRAGGARRPPRAPPRSRARSLRGPRPWAAGSGSRRRPTGSSPVPCAPGRAASPPARSWSRRRTSRSSPPSCAGPCRWRSSRKWPRSGRGPSGPGCSRGWCSTRALRARSSLRLVSALYWRDLADVAATARVPAAVRSRAESHLEDGLAGMRLGDRVTLARLATPALLPALLADADRRVVASALVNPRLREEDLVVALRRDDVPLALLESVAASSRWTANYAARLALVLQPRTPLALALLQISSLVARDLRRVAGDGALRPLVRAAAREVLDRVPGA